MRSTCAGVALALTATACRDQPSAVPDPLLPTGDGYLTQLGVGRVSDRYTAELWVRGGTGYTTTWGTRGARVGNAVKIWDVSGATPLLVDSLIVANATTLGDVEVSDDGAVLVIAMEYQPHGGIVLYSLANPRKPQLVTPFTSSNLQAGVHTAAVARVNGRLYAFCAVNPTSGVEAKLVIVDITSPAAPVEVSVLSIGYPFVHDVFVRDGLLFTAEWYHGLGIYDIGAKLGSPSNPQFISRVLTVGGQVHNVWWFHDPTNGAKRFAFVGEEGAGVVGSSSQGDIHVVDLSDLAHPREVAFYRVSNAGTHNFSMDEANGILYAAYYNAGVHVLDVRGDLGRCDDIHRHADGRCQLHLVAGRQKAVQAIGTPVFMWGVQHTDDAVYASDMLSGLFKFAPLRP
ncbi:MAG: hypothetical protein ABMA00_02030 [Gemmatimonas sp.]